MRFWLSILFVAAVTASVAAELDRDRYQLSDRGRPGLFEIAKDELHVVPRAGARRIEKLAPFANTEAVRQHADARRRATGDEYELVLYEVGQPRNEFTRRLLTKRVAVQLAPGADHAALAAAAGGRSRGETSYAPGWFLFETAETGGALAMEAALRGRPGVLAVEPQLARQRQKKLIPNDTYFTNQWHLLNTGQNGGTAGVDVNITNVWNTYRGNGINIAIVDDGLQWTHPDLTNHYSAALSWDFDDNDSNPYPNLAYDYHGTCCAGVAAGHGSNSVGICGAAFNATLVGLRLPGASTDAEDAAAFAHSNTVIHIKSSSWGAPDGAGLLDGPGPLAAAALAQGTAQGRNGKGVIYVFAAGNGYEYYEDANYDGYVNNINVIAVSAINDTNTQAYYSEPGACILVCAPSNDETNRQAITTTDLLGTYGYNTNNAPGELSNRDYTQTFGGTSSSCPLAAGVCALILQANPNLGWRDLQEILIRSATKNAASDSDWATNSAGFHFNHKFGAGLINANAAVALATNNWQNLTPQCKISCADTNLPVAIPDNNSNGVTRTFNMATFPALRVEHVTVTVNILHTWRGDLAITLTSPGGMTSRLAERNTNPNENYRSWTFSSVRHWGETSTGNWTVKIADLGSNDVGTVTALQLDIYGSTPNACLAITNATSTATLGNGNGVMDPGETVAETVILQNTGAAAASNITATLSTATPGITILQPTSTYPDLASGASASNATAYSYRLAKTVAGGTTINFTHIATATGYAFTNTFSHIVGLLTTVYSTNSITNTVSQALVDADYYVGTTISTNVVAVPSTSIIDDVNVFVRLNHTWDSDLDLSLQHPEGKFIYLSIANGGSLDNYGSGSIPTTFDDSAATIITDGAAPFAGSYRPEQPLSIFNGEYANGTWWFYIDDWAPGDTGTLLYWGLVIASHTNQYVGTLYNTAPVASSANYTIPSDFTTNITLAATDADADTLTYLTNNVTVFNPFPYTPPSGFRGVTNFTFAATDAYATSSVATVTFTVLSNTLDTDGDGFTDWHEYLAGTNPTNSASVLRLLSTQSGVVQFNSVTGRTYRIEYKNDLKDTSWQFLLTTNGTGNSIQLADPDAATLTQRFYRIRLLSPP